MFEFRIEIETICAQIDKVRVPAAQKLQSEKNLDDESAQQPTLQLQSM